MTLEAARPQDPLSQGPQDPRQQLAALFRKPDPSVTVIVKKRRIATVADGTVGPLRESAAEDGHGAPDEAAMRGPRVHRASKPQSDQSVLSRAASPAETSEAPPQRRRRMADPLRQPGEVRIVVQTPAAPEAEADDAPVWQRLLCRPAEEVTYQQVRRALGDLEMTVIEARLASKTRIV
jgi:hypothetical protein